MIDTIAELHRLRKDAFFSLVVGSATTVAALDAAISALSASGEDGYDPNELLAALRGMVSGITRNAPITDQGDLVLLDRIDQHLLAAAPKPSEQADPAPSVAAALRALEQHEWISTDGNVMLASNTIAALIRDHARIVAEKDAEIARVKAQSASRLIGLCDACDRAEAAEARADALAGDVLFWREVYRSLAFQLYRSRHGNDNDRAAGCANADLESRDRELLASRNALLSEAGKGDD